MPLSLQCPICQDALAVQDKKATCPAGHSFDRAKQGYFHLLPVQRMRSRNPGDSQEMIEARSRFLDTDQYQPVVNTIIEAAAKITGDHPVILDAGCGQGYYTSLIKDGLNADTVCGFDISKPAILACCRRRKDIDWLVASVSDIPVADNSIDLVISVFSRCDWSEFSRVLKPGGHILVMAPGQNHLLALRQAIYDEVRSYPEHKVIQDIPNNLTHTDTTTVTGQVSLNNQQAIQDLLAMTPHFWHIKSAQRERLAQRQQLDCSFDMRLYTLQNT